MTRRRLLLAFASVALLVGVVGIVQAQPTLASWTRSNFHNATVSSGMLYPVTSLTCAGANGIASPSVTLNWTQPQTTGNGLTPTSYTLSWTGTAGTGSTTVAGLTGAVSAAGMVSGNLTVTVRANLSNWQSAVSTQSRTLNVVAALGLFVTWSCA